MATVLAYLDGFDIVACTATVTAIGKLDDTRSDVQLDKTCFYPRGGGQDWDEGTIAPSDGLTRFKVDEVRLDESGIVHHFGVFDGGSFAAGDTVECAVDAKRRSINTRLHSAGHVVDMAVDRLKLPWIPDRGGHYPHMSFVEYEGEIASEDVEAVRSHIEQITNEIIAKGGRNEIRFMPVSEMYTICRHVPTNIPANKPARVVIYNGSFGVPCGGTHVADLNDIGRVTITKVKSKKGLTKVPYAVEGIN